MRYNEESSGQMREAPPPRAGGDNRDSALNAHLSLKDIKEGWQRFKENAEARKAASP